MSHLSATSAIQKGLAEIADALTPAERQDLVSIHKATTSDAQFLPNFRQDIAFLAALLDKGLCVRDGATVRLFSLLFADYVGKTD